MAASSWFNRAEKAPNNSPWLPPPPWSLPLACSSDTLAVSDCAACVCSPEVAARSWVRQRDVGVKKKCNLQAAGGLGVGAHLEKGKAAHLVSFLEEV